jgi:hypothetical protein
MGRRVGCVFGTKNKPTFRLARNGTEQTSWGKRGWKLTASNTAGRFDFVQNLNAQRPLQNVVKEVSTKDIAKTIATLLTGTLPPGKVKEILTTKPASQIPSEVSNVDCTPTFETERCS